MTDREEDKLGMYYSVEGACKKHRGAWARLPAFVTAYNEFRIHVADIAAAAGADENGVIGVNAEKSAALQSMINEAFPISAALQGWAIAEGDTQLAARIYYPRAAYLRARDIQAESIARSIHAEAKKYLDSLADFGITKSRLDALSASIDAYHAAVIASQANTAARKISAANLKELFSIADSVLQSRMDKLVPILGREAPAFEKDYENARIMVGVEVGCN